MILAAQWTGYLLWWLLAAVGIALGALYAGLETGIYVLNKIRLDLRAESGSRAARAIRRHLGNTNNLLAVLLVGVNAAAYMTTFSVSAMFVLSGAGHRAEWYTLATVTPLLFILAESVPKNAFQRLAEGVVYRFAWLLAVSNVVFNLCGLAALVRAFSWMVMRFARMRGRTRPGLEHQHRLEAAMAEGAASGVLTRFQTGMAERVMNLSEVTLGDVMTPMSRAFWAPRAVSAERFVTLLRGHDHRRVPLREADGRVAGVVDIFDVLGEPTPPAPAEKMAPPFVLPADTPVTTTLYRMQRARAAMAIVSGPGGQHVGLATVKDLVEEIVGELAAW